VWHAGNTVNPDLYDTEGDEDLNDVDSNKVIAKASNPIDSSVSIFIDSLKV
jgi:hypothetical protein